MQSTKQILRRLPARSSGLGACGSRTLYSSPLVSHQPTLYLRPIPQTLRSHPPNHSHTRAFTNSAPLSKKGAKAAREATQSTSTTKPPLAEDDPSDFRTLESDITKTLERLRSDLSKLRSGGRFNPETLESLRVTVGKPPSTSTVRLCDIASVLPKGRTVQILVSEAEYVKPVASAIQSARDLNLTPQPDPTGQNPLLLVLNVPPPTAESRRAAVQAATRAGEAASGGIRNARGAQQKKIRAAQVGKTVRPDEIKKVGVQMEKVVERGMGEVKKILEGVKRVLDA